METRVVVCLALLIVPCLGSGKSEWKIPSVSDLPISSGSVGNIESSGNIDNIAQSSNKFIKYIGSKNYGIGNIANIAQADNGGYSGADNVVQSNINFDSSESSSYEKYDDEKYIERPCQVFDTYCIKRFFANHAKCKEVHGPVPDPMYRAQSTMFLARINLTITVKDVLYSGLNGRIEEFYINRKTDKLVLAIEFRDLIIYSKNAYFRYHRKAKEPIVNVDYVYANYNSIVSTIIIPNLKDLQLQKSEVFNYINENYPKFRIGSKAFDSPDPTVQEAKLQIIKMNPAEIQEAQLTDGPFYPATFIQYNLCNFDLKIL